MVAKIVDFAKGIGIQNHDIAIVHDYRVLIERVLPLAIDAMYEHLFELGHTKYFEGLSIDDIKARQYSHWVRLFEGVFDGIFENYARVIGYFHRMRSVTQDIYMQFYGYFTAELVRQIMVAPDCPDEVRSDLVCAILKFIYLDMTIATTSYNVDFVE